jgi:hypothetical protein
VADRPGDPQRAHHHDPMSSTRQVNAPYAHLQLDRSPSLTRSDMAEPRAERRPVPRDRHCAADDAREAPDKGRRSSLSNPKPRDAQFGEEQQPPFSRRRHRGAPVHEKWERLSGPDAGPRNTRDGRPTEAPAGRTRRIRCIGTTSARASSPTEGTRAPPLSQRGTRSSAGVPAASAAARRKR